MIIDLHAHSAASDGTDTPAELMTLAAAAGITTLGLTDHDTTGGWAPAAAARPDGLTLIRGAEFSAQVPAVGGWTVSVHVLGYLFDPDHPAIVAEHERLRAERLRRGLGIVDNMTAAGIPISREQVLRIAGDAPVGRPHIGRALVESGVVSSVSDAFGSLLSGRGGFYVQKADTPLDATVAMIAAAGGASVLAHPRARGEARALTRDRITALVDLGLTGLEVDHPDHGPEQRAELRALVADLGLVGTGSSDYHGHNKTLRLGQEHTDPGQLARLLDATSGLVQPLV